MRKDLSSFGMLIGLFSGLFGLVFRSMFDKPNEKSFMDGWWIGFITHILIVIVLSFIIKISIDHYIKNILESVRY